MEMDFCPVCESHGLVLSVKQVPGGMEVRGQCTVCGYACDSDYDAADRANDFQFEFDLPVETRALD
jgi:hypothetical protein